MSWLRPDQHVDGGPAAAPVATAAPVPQPLLTIDALGR